MTPKARDIDELGEALGLALAGLTQVESQTQELKDVEGALLTLLVKLARYWAALRGVEAQAEKENV